MASFAFERGRVRVGSIEAAQYVHAGPVLQVARGNDLFRLELVLSLAAGAVRGCQRAGVANDAGLALIGGGVAVVPVLTGKRALSGLDGVKEVVSIANCAVGVERARAFRAAFGAGRALVGEIVRVVAEAAFLRARLEVVLDIVIARAVALGAVGGVRAFQATLHFG